MPSPYGKREPDRGKRGHPPVCKLRYQPRPHLTIRVRGIEFDALLDTGSEGTFFDLSTAQRLQALGFPSQSTDRQVRLADGTFTSIRDIMTVPIEILGRRITHEFQVMPTLGVEVLVGVDLWARTRYHIPPPPIVTHREFADIHNRAEYRRG